MDGGGGDALVEGLRYTAVVLGAAVLAASSKSSARIRLECWSRAAFVSLSWASLFTAALAEGRFQVVLLVL